VLGMEHVITLVGQIVLSAVMMVATARISILNIWSATERIPKVIGASFGSTF